jgi:hypothetical protein
MGRLDLVPLVLGAAALVLSVTAGPAGADHGVGLRPEAMNPWVAALLWGAAGLAAAMIVAIVVMVFTRASRPDEPEEPPRP